MIPDFEHVTLTDEERNEAEQMLQDLAVNGYVVIDQHCGLRPGGRVRHRGEQWPEAFKGGTGWVLVITEKPGSAWSEAWGMPDVEMLVLFDEPTFSGPSRLNQLAQYHVSLTGGES